jgi:hypothetical protein
MPFDPTAYGIEIASVLATGGSMPLVAASTPTAEQRRMVTYCGESRPLVLAGLWTYLSCFDEAHKIAQDIHNADGSYWHAILHRREPDAANSAYWFRRVGSHPIFPQLRLEAEKLGYGSGANWDPFAFIGYCGRPDKESELIACAVTLAEWQLLFDHCARNNV